jgi:hypothetical protein
MVGFLFGCGRVWFVPLYGLLLFRNDIHHCMFLSAVLRRYLDIKSYSIRIMINDFESCVPSWVSYSIAGVL